MNEKEAAESSKAPMKPKRRHLIRKPPQFGEPMHTFDQEFDEYTQIVAEGAAQQIDRAVQKKLIKGARIDPLTGRVIVEPKRGFGRPHIPRLAFLLIVLVVSVGLTAGFAQWIGQIQVTTQVRVPIQLVKSTVTIPDMWANSSSTWIEGDVFRLNTYGERIRFSFKLIGTLRFGNESETQTLTRLFSVLTITLNDGTRNMTTLDGLATAITSFEYQVNADTPFRFIIEYATKDVQVDGTAAILILQILYTFQRLGV